MPMNILDIEPIALPVSDSGKIFENDEAILERISKKLGITLLDPTSLDGILIMDEKAEIVYSNQIGALILSKFSERNDYFGSVPNEILTIYRWMTESRQYFSQQNWLANIKVFIHPSGLYNIHARWIKECKNSSFLLLLRLEDQNLFLRYVAQEAATQYGLTTREQEVWLLHQKNYTYKEIAAALGITHNTVKKHMKSIFAKKRSSSFE